MKITTSMSTSSYESIYNQVQKDYLTLNSKRSSFSSTTSDATTKLNATDFSGWEDSVATKMKQAVDDFKGTVTSVESDLTAGNYNVLLTKISELVSALEKCKSIRNSLNNKEYSRRNTTRYEEDGKTPFTEIKDKHFTKQTGESNMIFVIASVIAVFGVVYVAKKAIKANA